MNLTKLYEEIEDHLEASRLVFQKSSLIEEEESLRSISEAKDVLASLKLITEAAKELIKEFPSLEKSFEKQYGRFSELTSREVINEICFLDEYLFPEKGEFPLGFGEEINQELLRNYILSFRDWCEDVKKKHISSQATIHENFKIEIAQGQLDCQCVKCLGDYKAKIRDTIYKECVTLIEESEEALHEIILTNKISYVSDYVHKLQKHLKRKSEKVRNRLKRGSLNKLESDIKSRFKLKFGARSELGVVYKERLKTYFSSLLVDEDLSPTLISDDEYERFFTQLNTNIWKQPHILKREHSKLTRSILAFKRKDISATILRDYLGQFWVHSVARRKTRHFVYHMGPTNSGKTYNAIQALSKAESGCYLAPLRLLASELFDTLNDKEVPTSLLTGEEVIHMDSATHFSSTIEMARLDEEFKCAVIDEIQMITDPQRGWAWTRALVNLNADEVHLCGDPSVLELVKRILSLTGDTLEICEYERKTELTVAKDQIKLVEMKKHDALIVFSRRNALKFKRDLENLNYKVSIVYGRLSPEVRREQARKFDVGETDIIVATDAISMGMNLPIQRIVFSATSKFFNSKEHPLTDSELKQIAGRAGRYKRFPEGEVTTLKNVDDGLNIVDQALNHKLEQKELAMVGPDLEIFRSVNMALEENNLKTLKLSEFLLLFNAMTFEKPFYCVDLKEMIEVAEMVEEADSTEILTDAEIFGFACAPINLGLTEHVQYFVWILTHYVGQNSIVNEQINAGSDDIDYLETAIKCVELYQWLSRHFEGKHFEFDVKELLDNKSLAVERLNQLLSEKTTRKCSSCGCKLEDTSDYNICEECFAQRRKARRPGNRGGDRPYRGGSKGRGGSSSDKKEGEGSSNRRRRGSSARKKPSSSLRTGKPKKNKAAAFKKG